MRLILKILSHYLPYREISSEGKPYLIRYYLGTLGKYRFYIHHFVDSDPDRGLHDHPWNSISIVLAGRYCEYIRATIPTLRIVRWLNIIPADKFHRVVLYNERHADYDLKLSVWSLFVHGPRYKEWGFMSDFTTRHSVPNQKLFAPDEWYTREYQISESGHAHASWWLRPEYRSKHNKGMEL